jgi:hypothetical protein
MIRIAIPALIVMLAVAGFVGAAGWNTSGDPRQIITLTERELSLPYRAAPPGDDPGLRLLLQHAAHFDALESRNWLSESRLREIGFSLDIPVTSPQAAAVYDHVPPRIAWVAFEYDGPAWREIERRRQLQPAERRPSYAGSSRLVPVDASLDYQRLATRYPAGHLIVRAVIALNYVRVEAGGPMVYGTLREVIPTRVAVPIAFRPILHNLAETDLRSEAAPRYEVDLAIGTLGLPYIRAVRMLGSQGTGVPDTR